MSTHTQRVSEYWVTSNNEKIQPKQQPKNSQNVPFVKCDGDRIVCLLI